MAVELVIPKLGMTMTEGTLVEWLVAEGEAVTAGQIIYRLETDKVENDIECPVDGVIHLSGEEGEVYDVGTQIGEIA